MLGFLFFKNHFRVCVVVIQACKKVGEINGTDKFDLLIMIQMRKSTDSSGIR